MQKAVLNSNKFPTTAAIQLPHLSATAPICWSYPTAAAAVAFVSHDFYISRALTISKKIINVT